MELRVASDMIFFICFVFYVLRIVHLIGACARADWPADAMCSLTNELRCRKISSVVASVEHHLRHTIITALLVLAPCSTHPFYYFLVSPRASYRT